MKIVLAIVLIIVGSFMSYVAIGGFLEKQSKEAATEARINNSQPDKGTPSGATPTTSAASKTYTSAEVATHNSSSDCWLIIDGKVYSVNKYIVDHPGGASAIIDYCGKEASKAFATQNRGGGGHSSQARSILGDYEIGLLKN